jgi:cyclopropane fatty-acyl-phospholipid synthase-like methyltransferase
MDQPIVDVTRPGGPEVGTSCRVCSAPTRSAGRVHGSFSGRDYELRRCDACGYAFIADPWLDFDRIYDEAYYRGAGADPLVDYAYELDQPDSTVRQYEWRGIARIVSDLVGPAQEGRLLDFGCGNGGLVRYLRNRGVDAVGFEEGHIAGEARNHGIPILERAELDERRGKFDVVTAIEVFEHTTAPLDELRLIRSLLRPGGLLFLTTGNAAPFSDRLNQWRYVIPEIHVSFFEPRTLVRAMERTGFRPESLKATRGFDEIMKFKALKNLHVHERTILTDLLPARAVGLLDARLHLREQPIGWAI